MHRAIIHLRRGVYDGACLVYGPPVVVGLQAAVAVGGHGYAEVGKDYALSALVGVKEVGGFDVAVQDVMLVAEVDGCCHLHRHLGQLFLFAFEAHVGKRAARAMLHHLKVVRPMGRGVCPHAVGIDVDERTVVAPHAGERFKHVVVGVMVGLVKLQDK